jgi:hypothetical protein
VHGGRRYTNPIPPDSRNGNTVASHQTFIYARSKRRIEEHTESVSTLRDPEPGAYVIYGTFRGRFGRSYSSDALEPFL